MKQLSKYVFRGETFVKDLQPGQMLKDLEAEKHTDDIVMILSVEQPAQPGAIDRVKIVFIDQSGTIEVMNEPWKPTGSHLEANRTIESYELELL